MNVLQILPELNVGGVETGTVDFAKYLVAEGHRAVVVSNGGVLVEDLEKAGVKHYGLPVHKKSFWSVLRCIKSLIKIIQNERIDIVHARSRVPAWIAFFSCRKTNAIFVTTCHGYYGNHFFSRVMGWGKRVIVPSEVIGRHMIDDFRVSSQNIRRIPRSVDLQKFHGFQKKGGGTSSPVISMIGRITPLKGHTYFLKSMAQVVRSMPHVRIRIIGDVPSKKESYKEELQLLVKHLGLKDHVEFFGNRRDIPRLLSETDVLVLSTVTQEAFGRVILEAQAARVPVVATKVGGVVDIIDEGRTGLLVLPKDTEGMAQAVLKILNDPKLAAGLVAAAEEKLKDQFTLGHMAEATLKVYEELSGAFNILVIKLSSLGDVALAVPSLKAIRQKFPKARISCLVGKESRKILQRCPYLNDLIIYDSKHKNRGWWRLLRFARKLRRHGFDKVIDFQNNTKSHWLSFLSFCPERYGYNNGKFGFLLSHKIKDRNPSLPPVPHQFQVLKMLNIDLPKDLRLELWPSEEDELYIQKILDSEWLGHNPKMVGMNLAASQKWKTKNWPLEYMIRLCDLLSAENIRVIITGMNKDRDQARRLLQRTKTKPANFVGKTDILQLAALIKRCQVYVSPDSAPMHVAAAVGVPFVALFGPTDPQRHLPPAQQFSVLKRDLKCSPCYSSRCRIFTHACMQDIPPEEVMKEIKGFVGINNQ